MSDENEETTTTLVSFDPLEAKKTWGWRSLYIAFISGTYGGFTESGTLVILSVAFLFVGAWMINSYRHGRVERVVTSAYERVIALEKLAGVEYELEDDGDTTMRFRGSKLSLIALEDLAARMKTIPLDVEEESTDADNA